MKLPLPENAVIDESKLAGYCLSEYHPRGKHKARLFGSLLGLTAGDAFQLREILREVAKSQEAVPTKKNEFGQYYEIRFDLPGNNKRIVKMLSVWIVRYDEEFSRLVTVYPV
jgi:hypothetical protein